MDGQNGHHGDTRPLLGLLRVPEALYTQGVIDLLVDVVCECAPVANSRSFLFMCLHGIAELCMNKDNMARLLPRKDELVPVILKLVHQDTPTSDDTQSQVQVSLFACDLLQCSTHFLYPRPCGP